MRVFVVMSNDFPAGVMDDEAKAEAFCKAKMLEQKRCLKMHMAPRIYWRVYPFELNQEQK